VLEKSTEFSPRRRPLLWIERGIYVLKRSFAVVSFFLCLLIVPVTVAQTAPPSILFTDIQSGPQTGGQNNFGSFVTIFGTGFGSSQGSSTVTIGGGAANNCPVWGTSWLWYQKITCQVGPNVASGPIVVTVGGVASQCQNTDVGCNFTVRSGNIYFVAVGGNDSSNGSFTTPWATFQKALNTVVGGDITYFENGVTQYSQQNYNAALWISGKSGTATNPIALLAYPGATVSVGNGATQWALRGSDYQGTANYWVISGMTFRGGNSATELQGVQNWRIIGNDQSCPGTPGGQDACWETDVNAGPGAAYIYAFGNHMHNFPSNDKQYHGMYFSTNADHIWLGWNSIHDGACRGIQFHSTGAPNQYDLHVHDNTIYNIRCDGINMATIAPQNGPVEVYNNVIFHTGLGPDFGSQGPAAYTCILSPGITNAGSPGTGTAYFYSNTLYDCSSRSTSGGGTTQGAIGINGGPHVQLNNNVVVATSSDAGGYLSSDSTTTLVSGSDNLCFGAGSCPASFGSGSVNVDPLFVLAAANNFHLLSGSAAIGAGTGAKSSSFDHDGLIRPTSPSIGAYELTSGAVAQRPTPPTNLSILVQ
jgi:hypothetical protein